MPTPFSSIFMHPWSIMVAPVRAVRTGGIDVTIAKKRLPFLRGVHEWYSSYNHCAYLCLPCLVREVHKDGREGSHQARGWHRGPVPAQVHPISAIHGKALRFLRGDMDNLSLIAKTPKSANKEWRTNTNDIMSSI